jgi:hypothetical protein
MSIYDDKLLAWWLDAFLAKMALEKTLLFVPVVYSIRGTFDEALQMTAKSSGAHGACLDYPEHL